MKRIYLVLGEGNVGKSTLIRCLTGIRIASRIQVRETTLNDLTVWAYMRSVQEGNTPMSPSDLLHDITKPEESQFHDYLIPIRITAFNNCPNYSVYVNTLVAGGCTIVQAVALTQNTVAPVLGLPVVPISITTSHLSPANANADIVRTAWGWQ